jgi:serine/threonine protein kinase
MSPEQTRSEGVDARTNIWALGVILHEIVAGRVPFDSRSASDLVVAILDRERGARLFEETTDYNGQERIGFRDSESDLRRQAEKYEPHD